jgi:enoyl-CoA hydratase/carnithine racemase
MPIHFEGPDDEHIVTITIDRPQHRNSLDFQHFHDLAEAWRTFGEDDQAWVAIITGVGKDFMTGADLKTYIPEITSMQKAMREGVVEHPQGWRLRDGTDAVLRNAKLYKPIIAAINGPCVAGGMEMLGGIDIRIATPNATFGVMEPARGLFAGGGTTVRLPRQLPFAHAMEFLLTAERFTAERAFEMGLLNRVVPEESLMDEARAFARRILANAPLAVQGTKESVLKGLLVDLKEAYGIEQEISQRVFSTEDAKEGPKAFAEKRKPNWQAR